MKSKAYLDVRAMIQSKIDNQPTEENDNVRKSKEKMIHISTRNNMFKGVNDVQKAM